MDSEAVKAHITLLVYPRYGVDVARLRVLRHVKVLQYRACRHHGILHAVHAEALERCRAKLSEQPLARCLGGHHPVVKLKDAHLVAEMLLIVFFHAALIQHLLGLQRGKQLLHIAKGAFACQKLARADVEKRHSTRRRVKEHGSKKVVFLVV